VHVCHAAGAPTQLLLPSSLRRVRTVVFDKTGTLTAGKPAVVDFRTWQPEVRGGRQRAGWQVLLLAQAVAAGASRPSL